MSASLPLTFEMLKLLKFLRDHNYIQGLAGADVGEISRAVGIEESWASHLLSACRHHRCVNDEEEGRFFITPVGLKTLLQEKL